jgi:small-conductance mechanosensitive channel
VTAFKKTPAKSDTHSMATTGKLSQPWIPIERIESVAQLEPALFVAGFALASFLFYKLFLRDLAPHRHQNLKRHFKNLSFHLAVAVLTFVVYQNFGRDLDDGDATARFMSYLGLFSILSWTTVFIKSCKIALFEYLFFNHKKQGVPLLLINLLTLVLTVIMGGWILAEVFAVNLGPLLATSAIFSLVLGLALQDTLGNLFAGVAMQFDKPYEIGDWIEIVLSDQKWVGQVNEISWRATVLTGISDESITIPNRLIGQTQISNYSTRHHPICRSQLFRIAYDAPFDEVRMTLEQAGKRVNGILQTPAPFSYLFESHDSFVVFKLVYYFDDYGKQFVLGDRVMRAGIEALSEAGLSIASPKMKILHESASCIAK